jgi:tRNA U34 5-carboxymethylaminomethyl modifying GTPase MnmE/TrmE
MEAGAGPDVVGTMLSSILSGFGEISGRVFSEQLLASVFGRFCVGK